MSLKASLSDAYAGLNMGKGIVRSLIEDVGNDFYRLPGTPTASFPYRGRIRILLTSLKWPANFKQLSDYPEDREPGWSNELQGVSHDARNWFFTQRGILWRFPITHDLNSYILRTDFQHKYLADLPLPEYDHFGDLDYYDGLLYVAVEAAGFASAPKVAIFDAETLEYLSSDTLTGADKHAGWCAVNRLNRCLYSSEENTAHLDVYSLLPDGLAIVRLGEFELYDENGQALTVTQTQGGVFSESGHLYLSFGGQNDPSGIWGFDMVTGRRVKRIDWTTGFLSGDEAEGLTIWDLDLDQPAGVTGHQPQGIRGQLHHVMIDNWGVEPDDFFFKHFRVESEERDRL